MVILQPSMVENLIAEGIGIAVTAVLFTFIGGWLANRAASHAFEQRWSAYRKNLAHTVNLSTADLGMHVLDLAVTVSAIAGKALAQINKDDLERFRYDLQKLRSSFDRIEGFLSRHYFALREQDIAKAQLLVVKVAELRRALIDDQLLTVGNFELLLSSHVQGSQNLSQQMPQGYFNGTRYDFIVAIGTNVAQTLKNYSDFTTFGNDLIDTLSH